MQDSYGTSSFLCRGIMDDVHCVLCNNLGEITLLKKAMQNTYTEKMYQYLKEETPEEKLLCTSVTNGPQNDSCERIKIKMSK